jgi:hypothetical protein
MSHLEDDNHLSGDFHAVETPDSRGHKQSIWVAVRPAWYGHRKMTVPMVQISYQEEHGGSMLEGPVFLTPETWRALNKAVEDRLWEWHYNSLWQRIRRLAPWIK